MKIFLILLLLPLQLLSQTTSPKPGNADLHKLFDDADEEFLKMNPVAATFRGDNRIMINCLSISRTATGKNKKHP
jgi:hypothetical protein